MKKKISPIAGCLTLWAVLALPSIVCADVILEYRVRESGVSPGATQRIAIKNDRIMVKGANGDKNLDLLYLHTAERVMVVDHRKGTVMTVDEAQVDRLNQQAQKVVPLLEGLGEKIADLSPEQREEWQELLGDTVSLAAIAGAAEPAAPIRWVPAGEKKVAGIHCKTMRIMDGETPLAEVCLADAAAMNISNKDAATIRSLMRFYERLAAKSRPLARQLGLLLPDIPVREATEIPVEFRDLADPKNRRITLNRITQSIVSPELMRIPGGYRAVPLMPWQ